jgi:aquaporin Z
VQEICCGVSTFRSAFAACILKPLIFNTLDRKRRAVKSTGKFSVKLTGKFFAFSTWGAAMKGVLWRALVVEMLGTFALVFIGAGVVCVNHLTLPAQQQPAAAAALAQHPGLVGIALAQGFILAVALAATMHVSGGFLNPAITLMLWVFGRLDSVRMAWLIGAQLLGGVLAGLCLRLTFSDSVLAEARLGTPHLSLHAYPELQWSSLCSGACIELVLTFFLVFAIFGAILKREAWLAQDETGRGTRPAPEASLQTVDARLAGVVAGLTLTACVVFGYPLTGAATNPARWFGTVLWEASLGSSSSRPGPFADLFVYIAGPVVGALLAGVVYFRILAPQAKDTGPQPQKASTTAPRGKK